MLNESAVIHGVSEIGSIEIRRVSVAEIADCSVQTGRQWQRGIAGRPFVVVTGLLAWTAAVGAHHFLVIHLAFAQRVVPANLGTGAAVIRTLNGLIRDQAGLPYVIGTLLGSRAAIVRASARRRLHGTLRPGVVTTGAGAAPAIVRASLGRGRDVACGPLIVTAGLGAAPAVIRAGFGRGRDVAHLPIAGAAMLHASPTIILAGSCGTHFETGFEVRKRRASSAADCPNRCERRQSQAKFTKP